MDLKSHPTDEQLERFVLGESAIAKLVLVALPEEIRTMRRHP